MTGLVGAGRVHRAVYRGTRRKQRERWSHRVIVSPPRVMAKATRANTSVFSPNAHPTGVGTHHTFPRTNTENTAQPLRNSGRLLWYAPVGTPVLHDLGSLPDPGPARSVPPTDSLRAMRGDHSHSSCPGPHRSRSLGGRDHPARPDPRRAVSPVRGMDTAVAAVDRVDHRRGLGTGAQGRTTPHPTRNRHHGHRRHGAPTTRRHDR